MRKIALQSAIGGMLLSLIGIAFASCGLITPVFGALTVNLGAGAGTQFIVLQPIVTALTTVLTAVGTFATAVGVALPAVAPAAVTLNTAIGTFAAGASTYITTKTKAA
jgi:hypothetical protein